MKDTRHHHCACARSVRCRTSLIAGVLALALAGAAIPTVSNAQQPDKHAPGETVRASAAVGPWGFDISGMDTAIRPGNGFFDYANGAWAARTVIPPDKSRFGVDEVLNDRTQEQIHDIVTEASRSGAAPDTDAGKIGALYNSFMDEDRIERLDIAPIADELAEIRKATTKTAIAALMGRSVRGFGSSLFDLSVSEDEKDPDRNTLYSSQDGLGLPDRDYYLKDAFRDKKAAYRDYVAHLLDMAGWQEPQPIADEVVAFETRVAEASWSRAESRDPDKTYNPQTPAELATLAPDFPWAAWLDAAGVPTARVVVVAQKSAFPKLARIFADTPVATLQAWEAFRVIDEAAPYLSKRFESARFDFRGRTLAGQAEEQPRWRRAMRLIDASIGEAVGREYVARHFPPEAKARAEELVAGLKRALRGRIDKLAWMTPETKARALEKLDLIDVKIGYPKKWKDYTALAMDPADLAGNVRRAAAFRWAEDVAKLDKPVDRGEWLMTPQTVNAYYEPSRNEIVFPAAILQPPFFDPNADMAVNYGGIGGIIGHEITHAFDDQGRKFDGHGVLSEWWKPEDAERFQAEAVKYGAQFDTYEVGQGVHVNGDLTMGENIADLGGILIALDAYRASLKGAPAPVLDGMTGDQRVFLGWAQSWRSKYRTDAVKQLVASNPHSPPWFRVDGPLRNVDAWYDAFGVKPGDRLYLPPDKRVRIW